MILSTTRGIGETIQSGVPVGGVEVYSPIWWAYQSFGPYEQLKNNPGFQIMMEHIPAGYRFNTTTMKIEPIALLPSVQTLQTEFQATRTPGPEPTVVAPYFYDQTTPTPKPPIQPATSTGGKAESVSPPPTQDKSTNTQDNGTQDKSTGNGAGTSSSTDTNMISGVPNWALLAAAAGGAFLLFRGKR